MFSYLADRLTFAVLITMVGSDEEALQLAAALQASMQEAGQQPLECESGFGLELVPDGEEEHRRGESAD